MKTIFSAYFCSISLGSLLILSACSKQEDPASTASTPPPSPAPVVPAAPADTQTPPVAVKAAVDTAVTEVKTPEAGKPPEIVAPPAPVVTAAPVAQPAASSPAQGILDRVKGLVAEQKYSEALTTLSELSNTSLTSEQQNMVKQLKTQISSAMAAKAGSDGLKSVGGLLNQKK